MWSPADIADVIAAGIRAEAERLDREQAVLGIDARDELELHPLIRDALDKAGFGVSAEQRYPHDRIRRRRSEGERCDVVLTPQGTTLAEPDAEATLFAPNDAVDLGDAFWLEVKVVGQYTLEGANAAYSSELMHPVRQDVAKLARDPGIRHAAVLLVLFTTGREVAEHDLSVWERHCIRHDLPIAPPAMRHVEINDRLGNALCSVVVYPVGPCG
jgi:hypothetical protein